MNAERWQQVEDLYHRAEERAPNDRSAFLAHACQGDQELLREVKSLLNHPAEDDHILNHSAAELVADPSVVQLSVGAALGPYKIEALLGAGGMGVVYKARDTRLDRSVAIKICRRQFSERFRREARVLASLNHTNICHLYDVGPNYLVMELVEGPTLDERIKTGPIPLEESLDIAGQIARALEVAHEKGITHRDLKPGNVKIRSDGTVKTLDFGLAKVAPDAAGDPETSPTVSLGPTEAGMILGTAAYMAPEQARGERLDARADIWAYGVVLWEMLTGQRLFTGKTVSDTLASVLKEEPDLSRVPAKVQRLLRSCLQKDPTRRLHHIADAKLLVEDVEQAPGLPPTVPGVQIGNRRHWILEAAAVVFVIVSAVTLWTLLRTPPPDPRPVSRWTEDRNSTDSGVALSRDGTRLAYTNGAETLTALLVRTLDQPEPKVLSGPVNPLPAPSFSPDGLWLAYFDGSPAAGGLKKIPVTGGPPVDLCQDRHLSGGGLSWGEDGNIVFTGQNSGLMRVPSAGGICEQLTTVDAQKREIHGSPQVLPGSQSVLFTLSVMGLFDNARVAVLDLKSKRYRVVTSGGAAARYVPSSHLVYVRSGTMFAVPFDLKRMAVTGAETPVIDRVFYNPASGFSDYAFSESGLLVYRMPGTRLSTLEWRDRNGVPQPLSFPPKNYMALRLSPEGKRAAVAIGRAQSPDTDVSIVDLATGGVTPLTSGAPAASPLWTPDGRHVTFSTPDGVYWTPADGSGKPELLFAGTDYMPNSWTPDGKSLLGSARNFQGDVWIWTAPSNGGSGKPRPFFNEPDLRHSFAVVSPDGRWVAYDGSDPRQPGSVQVYVRPFSGPGGRISIGGGILPQWSRDGRELFYVALGAGYTAVDIHTSPTISAGQPHPLFGTVGNMWEVAPDGKRFLVANGSAVVNPFQVVVNWFDEVRRKSPSR